MIIFIVRLLTSSILFDHGPQGEDIIGINGSHCCHEFPLLELRVLVGNAPGLAIPIVCHGSVDHVNGHADDVALFELCAVLGASGVAVVPQLPVVDAPPIERVAECPIQAHIGPAHPDFQQLPLVYKYLEVVTIALREDLGA